MRVGFVLRSAEIKPLFYDLFIESILSYFLVSSDVTFSTALYTCVSNAPFALPSPPPPPTPVREHASTRAVSSGVPLLLSWREGAPDGGGGVSVRIQHTTHTTPCKRRYLSLWVRLPDLHRVRPHYVDSTASRPICEVKLRQAGLVVWFVRTCEVLVLYFILQIFCEFLLQGGIYNRPGSTPGLR